MVSTVLITGASQGIGKATALLFAQKGYDVVIAARNSEKLAQVAEEIRLLNRKVLAIPTDVSDRDAVTNLVDQALANFYHIDVLVNNAGICMSAPMVQTTIEEWQQIINVNLWGYIYTIKALLPHFLSRQQGTIINVGSFGSKVPLPNMTAYCTTKYAIAGLSETLRLELESSGIHVCGVHPSVTKTSFLERAVFKNKEGNTDNQQAEQMKKFMTSPLASSPEDVAKAIWQAVKHPQAEIIVGSAKFPATLYRLFPGLTQWVFQQAT
ncbi:short-chain dehydrogenase/reductase SDR [Stanieria sp. NIES-3757]|nr:short-chain dehydrogenase/reductase SDR [Stanieria sp. NIES-3757]